MKTIGLLGGMSWESTATYYSLVNTAVKERLGGLHSAKCVLYSVDFQPIEECQKRDEWDKAAGILAGAARALERAGADFFLLCTNTMHKVAPALKSAVGIPFLHIADITADALLEKNIRRVGLLGTRYTMEQDFYKGVLASRGLDTLIPGPEDRARVNSVIFDELCLGRVRPESKRLFLRIVDDLAASGAEGVILGCTEIGMLISQSDTAHPLFDTTRIHAIRAAMLAMTLGEL